MRGILGPKVTIGQGPIVTMTLVTFGPMSQHAPTQTAVHAQFAARMNEICDDMHLPSSRGRQSALADVFKVNPKAARKWLVGIGYPEMATACRIADWAGVSLLWLLQGYGPKHPLRLSGKAQVLDEAIHSLPPDLGTDLIDNLRSKLSRAGKLAAEPTPSRYRAMLEAYEQDFSAGPKKPQ